MCGCSSLYLTELMQLVCVSCVMLKERYHTKEHLIFLEFNYILNGTVLNEMIDQWAGQAVWIDLSLSLCPITIFKTIIFLSKVFWHYLYRDKNCNSCGATSTLAFATVDKYSFIQSMLWATCLLLQEGVGALCQHKHVPAVCWGWASCCSLEHWVLLSLQFLFLLQLIPASQNRFPESRWFQAIVTFCFFKNGNHLACHDRHSQHISILSYNT